MVMRAAKNVTGLSTFEPQVLSVWQQESSRQMPTDGDNSSTIMQHSSDD